MIIIVSGTPGTGKTTLSKKLAKSLGFKYIDVNKIIQFHKLAESYDKKRKTKIIDTKKLNKILIQIIKKEQDLVIDSHLSHYLPSKYIDLCLICKCNLKELEKRLKKKRWHKEKIRENLDAEIFNICYEEAKQQKHKILVIDTSKKANIKQLTNKIKRIFALSPKKRVKISIKKKKK